MEPVTKPATSFSNPDSKPENSEGSFISESQKKAPLLSLSSDLLLKIADAFLDDFLAWKIGFPNSHHGDPDELDPFRVDNTHESLEYINFARTHPKIWNLLRGRKISDATLKEAKAKVQARRKYWQARNPHRISKRHWAQLLTTFKHKPWNEDIEDSGDDARPDFMLFSRSTGFSLFG